MDDGTEFAEGVEFIRHPEEYRARYERTGYWSAETVPDLVDRTFEECPNNTAVGPDRELTFEEIDDEVNRLVGGMREVGIAPGDVVSYQLPNLVTTAVVHIAISRVGAIANPIIPMFRSREVESILGDVGARWMFVPETYRGHDYLDMIASLAPDVGSLETIAVVDGTGENGQREGVVRYDELITSEPANGADGGVSADDVHAIFCTSGTTGEPKGVVHTHNTLLKKQRDALRLMGVSEETTLFAPAPVTHIGLWYAIELPLCFGANVVYMDEWDPRRAIELIEEHDCNLVTGATPFLRGLVETAPPDWENALRMFNCGGAPLPPALLEEAMETLDCAVCRGYGMTEFPLISKVRMDSPIEKFAETAGIPSPGVEVKVVDADGDEVPTGDDGELVARGPELMIGYTDSDLNDDSFLGEWFKTGDVARVDDDGYLEIVGRKKDMIVRGGENIPVKEVEQTLLEHDAVAEVAVVPMPDPELQEKGCAYVAVSEGREFEFEDMLSHLEGEKIARQKFPERLEKTDELPRTESGKVRKERLREEIASKVAEDAENA